MSTHEELTFPTVLPKETTVSGIGTFSCEFRGSFRFVRQAILTGLPLVVADVAAVFAAVCLLYNIATVVVEPVALHPLPIAIQAAGAMVLIAQVQRSYPGCGIHPAVEFKNGVIAVVASFSILMMSNFVLLHSFANGRMLLGAIPLALVLIPLFRSFTRACCERFRWWGFPAVVFSLSDCKSVYAQLVVNRRTGLRPVGIVAEPSEVWQEGYVESDAFLGSIDDAVAIADKLGAYWAVVSRHDLLASDEETRRNVEAQLAHFPRVLMISDDHEFPSLWSQSIDLNGMSGTLTQSRLMLRSAWLLKRLFDLIVSLMISVLCLPLIAVLGLAIKCTSSGPVFYAHRRLGRNGKSFRAWKLRSMYMNADQLLAKYLAADAHLQEEWEATHKLKSDPRITPIGRILRSTSLDELPQIWNVLRGEMSLVGPRPIVDSEIRKYRDKYRLFCQVTPGVTGLWQISGRNHTTYEQRVEYDAYYVRNWSFWLDLYILIRTIKIVVSRHGAF